MILSLSPSMAWTVNTTVFTGVSLKTHSQTGREMLESVGLFLFDYMHAEICVCVCTCESCVPH